MDNRFLAALILGLGGCAELPPAIETPRSPDLFYVEDPAALEPAKAAFAEWAEFGFSFSVTTEKPSGLQYYSAIRLVDQNQVCSAWPNVPDNLVGCAYAIRHTEHGPLQDSAMTARANGDAIAYIVDIERRSDIRREILHETGHVAGFCHVPEPVVMNAYVNPAAHLVPADLSRPCDRNLD